MMLLLNILFGFLTAIGITAATLIQAEREGLEDSEALCLGLGAIAGIIYPITWALLIIYLPSKTFKDFYTETQE